MLKITRNDINKENMVVLSYCQCQTVMNLFGYEYKVGYNSGVYGWNYDLYRINDTSIVTGYNVPYSQYSDEEKKKKLVALDNEIRKTRYTNFEEYEEHRKKWFEEFLEIFE